MKQSASVIDKHNLEKYVDHFVIPKVYNWRRINWSTALATIACGVQKGSKMILRKKNSHPQARIVSECRTSRFNSVKWNGGDASFTFLK